MSNIVSSSVHADGLAPLGSTTSAGKEMAKVSYIISVV